MDMDITVVMIMAKVYIVMVTVMDTVMVMDTATDMDTDMVTLVTVMDMATVTDMVTAMDTVMVVTITTVTAIPKRRNANDAKSKRKNTRNRTRNIKKRIKRSISPRVATTGQPKRPSGKQLRQHPQLRPPHRKLEQEIFDGIEIESTIFPPSVW